MIGALPARPPSASLAGHYAGFPTRFGAFVLDVIFLSVAYAIVGTVVEYTVDAVTGASFSLADVPVVSGIAFLAWAFLYSAYPLSVSGHTLGMAIAGIRATRADGSRLDTRHAVIRVLALPLSFVLFGFGFLLVLLRRDRRALHDCIAKSAVTYSWDARAAHLRFLSHASRGVTTGRPPAPGDGQERDSP